MRDITLDDITVAEINDHRVDAILEDNHPLGAAPDPPTTNRFIISGGIEHGYIGAAMWGRPSARGDNQTHRELRRFWTVDWTPKNTESYVLAQMMDRMLEDADVLISFASLGRHNGGIYRATNWTNMGLRIPSSTWQRETTGGCRTTARSGGSNTGRPVPNVDSATA